MSTARCLFPNTDSATANAKAADVKSANYQLQVIEGSESKLLADRNKIVQAIKGQKDYTDKAGNSIDPKEALQQNADDLVQLYGNKYNAYDKARRPPPDVSYADSVKGIRDGTEAILNPPKQTPETKTTTPPPVSKRLLGMPQTKTAPAAPQTKPAPKFTEAQARKMATDKGMNPADTEQYIKDTRAKGLIP